MNSLAWVRYHRREYPQAMALFREARELAPGDPWNYVGIGQSLIFTGEPDQGIAEIKKTLEVSPDYDFLLCYLAWGYGMAGKLDEAREVVEQLKQKAQAKAISPMAFAWAYTGMGLKDEAMDWLEKAYAERDGAVIMLRVPEFYDVLSSEPRYHALLKKMRLES
jgi:adenylate cyclase